MTYTKLLMAGWMAFAVAGAAAAELPGIDAPTGAGVGAGSKDERRDSGDRPAADVVTPGSGTLKDAIELCDRLGGTEKAICLQQAQENRERALAPGVGATPGGGAEGAVSERREAPVSR